MSSTGARADHLRDPGQGGRTDPALLQALSTPAMYGGGAPVAVHETHASWVFVTGARAYKIKKPVRFAFLNYSTLARRRDACSEEVRVNRELAPGIYLGVLAIVRTPGGFAFAAQDAAEPVEYAVEMASFQETDTLDGVIAAGELTPGIIGEVARRLAGSHAGAAAVAGGGPAAVLEAWRANARELDLLEHPARWDVDLIAGFGEAFVRAHAGEIGQRAREGLVRDGHGDLRCEHVLVSGPVRIVDRIEFDPSLRRTDIACDLAFLMMDLEAHGQLWAARELLDAYRRAGASPGSEALGSFYGAYRALVRVKVALLQAAEHESGAGGPRLHAAERLWGLAERLCWRARRPLAIVVCGPPASGKSTLAQELSRISEMPVVSSDVVRKRLAGIPPCERARPEHYSDEFTDATYEQLGREALAHLSHLDGVIVDATCRLASQRVRLLGRLQRPGATQLLVHCQAPLEVALRRAAERMERAGSVSDATPEVVQAQFRRFEAPAGPPGAHLGLSTELPLEVQTAKVARAVDERLGAAGSA
jgi:aminoglycoside phosphotransferase family enzyme/predicted kinase